MKNQIIIGHSKTKRILAGPFEMMGTKEVLESIAQQILHQVGRERFVEGWIQILPCVANNSELANNSPIPWDD